jgi:hypothetical protein
MVADTVGLLRIRIQRFHTNLDPDPDPDSEYGSDLDIYNSIHASFTKF